MIEEKIIEICKEVLDSLSKMGYESKGNVYDEKLIFPVKTLIKKENKKEETEDRISEQELRQLFIDKFKAKAYPGLYYSIETPTKAKYKFGESDKNSKDAEGLKNIKVDENGQSALLDMCIFKKVGKKYTRNLNIEFKHQNAPLKDIAKDVLKLMKEEQNGAFIFLLKNTNKGTLNNKRNGKLGVLDKLSKSFTEFYNRDNGSNWNGNGKKSIHLIILSLEQKKNSKGAALIYSALDKDNLYDLTSFFSMNEKGGGNIREVSENSSWCVHQINLNETKD
jgi:hypothetical protein